MLVEKSESISPKTTATVIANDYILRRTCKNCKFWQKREDRSFSFGDCLKFDSEFEDGNLAATTYDDSTLHTKAEFGCIQFEAKDAD